MRPPEDAGKYQVENQNSVPGQVIGDGNIVHNYYGPVYSSSRRAIFMKWLNMTLGTAAFDRAVFMNRLNIALGIATLVAVLVAIVLNRIAPDWLTFTNVLGNAAYLASLVICCSELYVLAVYRQWRLLVSLLVVGAGVYFSNSIFVFSGYVIYIVATIVPLVFSSFGWFYTSRKTIAMKP